MRPELQVLELLLGEGTEEQRTRLRGRVAEEPALAIELAETTDILESCRGLTVEPTGRVEQMMAIRVRLHQRQLHRRPPNPAALPLWGRLVGVAAVAALALVSLLLLPGVRRPGGSMERELMASAWAPTTSPAELPRNPGFPNPRGAAPNRDFRAEPDPVRRILPVEAPRFKTAFGRFSSLAVPDAFDAVVSAHDGLELLRVEFSHRSTPQQRRNAIAATGGNPDVDDRVQDLALEVARMINQELDRHEAGVLETSLAMRALFASGSDTQVGRLRNTVRRCALWMEARLDGLSGGELASALIALSEP